MTTDEMNLKTMDALLDLAFDRDSEVEREALVSDTAATPAGPAGALRLVQPTPECDRTPSESRG